LIITLGASSDVQKQRTAERQVRKTKEKENHMNKAEILEEMELKTETVKLGKGEMIVSEIGAADYIRLWTKPDFRMDDDPDRVDMSKFTPALIAYSVVDEKGNRLFTDEDIPNIASWPQGRFTEIAQIARRLNGLGAVDAGKNSKASR
jgi:hypothetical protein